jgi:hypothetical protein
VIIGLGYCFYFIQGKFTERISKQPYNQLRDTNYFLRQLLLTMGIGLVGYYIRQVLLFMPFSFLIVFWVMNYLTELTTGKSIIFGTRWNAPKKKRWSSGFNTFLILMLTFTLTIGIGLAIGIARTSNEPSVLIDLKSW